ncbi:MAG: CBS domain-containing protein [Pirellulaceae bacterium]
MLKISAVNRSSKSRLPGLRRRGATAIEVALIMAILLTGILMVFAEVGGKLNRSLAHLAGEQPHAGGLSLASEAAADNPTASPNVGIARVLPQTTGEWGRFIAHAVQICVAIFAVGAIACQKKQRILPVEELEPLPPPSTTLPVALFEKRQLMLKVFGESLLRSHLADVPVTLVMSRRIERVEGSTPRDELRARMKANRVRHLAVCDPQGKLLGLVSDRDLGTREGTTAQDLMSPSPITVPPGMGLIPAVTLMINRGFSCLPVVEQGNLIGIFTSTDLLLAFQATLLMIQRPDAIDVGFGPVPAADSLAS